MSRIKGVRSSAALMVAVVALAAALGGGAVAGVTISKLNNKEKKQVKKISKRQAKKLDKKIKLTPGPPGERGPAGPAGQNATSLFAYFGSSGSLVYGNGVTADASQPGPGQYEVTFNRDLAGCVAFANAGTGDPDGNFGNTGGDTVANASDILPDDTVEVAVFQTSSGILTNRAFTLAVFC